MLMPLLVLIFGTTAAIAAVALSERKPGRPGKPPRQPPRPMNPPAPADWGAGWAANDGCTFVQINDPEGLPTYVHSLIRVENSGQRFATEGDKLALILLDILGCAPPADATIRVQRYQSENRNHGSTWDTTYAGLLQSVELNQLFDGAAVAAERKKQGG